MNYVYYLYNVCQSRHSHLGYRTVVLVVDEQFTIISNWSNESTYARRYNFFNTAKTLSNRQWAWHQVLNSTCLCLFHSFSTVRNLFGFRIDGIPEQLNFLFDENKTIGKDVTMTHCLNSVLPMLDWTMQTHRAD